MCRSRRCPRSPGGALGDEQSGCQRNVVIPSDVRLGGSGPHVLIVSGSNMSGKSTYLRTIGINAVLALAGAPVMAHRLRLSPLVLGATLRIQDSLQEGRSRFYAEILRVRQVVDLSRGPLPLLFLLDEILHGTNSRNSSKAVMRAALRFRRRPSTPIPQASERKGPL